MSKTVNATALAAAQSEGNQPVWLLEIALDSATLYYCNASADVTFPTGGQVYTALAQKDLFDSIRVSMGGEVGRCKVNLPDVDLTFSGKLAAEEFQGRTLTLKKVFVGVLGSAAYATTMFTGEMTEIEVSNGTFMVIVQSPAQALKRQVPRRVFDSLCPYKFGGTECGASLGTETGAAEAGSTTLQIIDTANRNEANDYWRDGILEWTSGDLDGEKQVIASSVLSTGAVNVINPFSAAPDVGDTYSIKLGCNKTASNCITRHNNWNNFGGFIGVTEKKE